MPINVKQQAVYLPGPTPESCDSPTLPAPGNIGQRFTTDVPLQMLPGVGPVPETGASKSYQIVLTDSAMGVSPTRGAVAWWKDKARYIVTTDMNAIGRNHVAGIFKNSVTRGNYTCIQYKGPSYVQITAADAAATVMNDSLIPSAADQGRAARIAAGTAPTFTKIGTAAGPVVGGNLILTQLELPETT